jgi:hypothetical protein
MGVNLPANTCCNRTLPYVYLLAIMLAIWSGSGAVAQRGGMYGHGHDALHHWYKTLRQPGTGYSCCNGQDCRRTTARVRRSRIEVLVDGEWTVVPQSTILSVTAPDLNTHVCAPKGPWSPKPIFCVVLGFGM